MSGLGALDAPRFTAAVDMVGRTGAGGFTMAIHPGDDDHPVVWIAMAAHHMLDGRPVAAGTPGARDHWETACSLDPLEAVLRLLDELIDGGTCAHCGRPSGFSGDLVPGDMPLDALVCWVQWDPEMEVFRQACAGGTP